MSATSSDQLPTTVNSISKLNGLRVSQDGNTIIHEKTIYAKRHSLTNKQLEGIMQLEISNFVREHPGYEFEKAGDTKKNDDQSRTYYLHFKKTIPQVK
jgi:hypothetical protein